MQASQQNIPLKKATLDSLESSLALSMKSLQANEQNGWWPYLTGQGPSTEATAWCALALNAVSDKAESSRETIAFLLKKQNADGGWSTAPACGRSDWSSAPAIIALRLLNEKNPSPDSKKVEKAVIAGTNFLIDLRVDPYHSVGRLLLFLMYGEKGLHYGRGWPWTRNCAYWVEPTAYSLLALKLPHVSDHYIIHSSIRFATAYLSKHVCLGGGWNHGCDFVLNVHAPAYTLTTAEALLALQDEERNASTDAALKLVASQRQDSHSSLTLAWSILALNAYGEDLGDKIEQLIVHQNKDGSFGTNNMVTALATLALLACGRGNNILKM